jgi:tRNA(fMet)-specific endonuclease VapC
MNAAPEWLLDTNTVSYLIRGHPPGVRTQIARRQPAALCISAITRSELLYGMARHPQATRINPVVREFLRWVDTLDWTAAVADRHGALRADLERRGIGMSTLDQMIAAHALALDLTLVSNDRVFEHVEGLRLENWAAEQK